MEENNTVVGEVCHIKGLKPTAARHDLTQGEDERNAFENLILMCSIHHKVIDEDIDSYTVERLREIKAEHESRANLSTSALDAGSEFDALLDQRIRLIIEHEKAKAEDPEQIEQASGPFALAKKMAEQRRFEEKRGTMLNSIDGIQEVIRSIHWIFTRISQRHEEEKDTFLTIGIEVHSGEEHRVVATDEFGSQVVLKGFEGTNHYRVPDSLRLELMLFGKRSIRQPGAEGKFYTNPVSVMTLKPDFDPTLKVVWIDDKRNVFTRDQLVDRVFNDLLQKLEDERILRESLPEGRFRWGGQYVDLFGNPIGDENRITSVFRM
ncbi:MAG: hypothetical protein ABL959_13475 [Pyrinomonadaceae bacterium]